MSMAPIHRQILIALNAATSENATTDPVNLRRIGQKLFQENLKDWGDAYKDLLNLGLITLKNNSYRLTKKGANLVEKIRLDEMSYRYDQMLLRCESSRACIELNERLYGMDLGQFNMMSMNQLQKMLDELNLQPGENVLDIGCGNGIITEYISDITGAHISGVDFAEKAIHRAMERSVMKRNRLRFFNGDMNALNFPKNSFDVILSIDTLYFVKDLHQTMKYLTDILKPSGRMGIFWSQIVEDNQAEEVLLPNQTPLVEAVSKFEFHYRYWEFSEEEKRYWKLTLELAEELRDKFEAEGNLAIYHDRIDEATTIIEKMEDNGLTRYLYIFQRG